MRRIAALVFTLASALTATAQTTDAPVRPDTALAARERSQFGLHTEVSLGTGSFGRGRSTVAGCGASMRLGTIVTAFHRAVVVFDGKTSEDRILAGTSLPLSPRVSLEVTGGVSMMRGYAEGKFLKAIYHAPVDLWLFVIPGFTEYVYEHHELGTGAAARIAISAATWDWMRLGIAVEGRTELKEYTTMVNCSVTMQVGAF